VEASGSTHEGVAHCQLRDAGSITPFPTSIIQVNGWSSTYGLVAPRGRLSMRESGSGSSRFCRMRGQCLRRGCQLHFSDLMVSLSLSPLAPLNSEILLPFLKNWNVGMAVIPHASAVSEFSSWKGEETRGGGMNESAAAAVRPVASPPRTVSARDHPALHAQHVLHPP